MPDPVAIASSPVVVWVAILVACLVLVAGAFPKVLGPVSQSVNEWARRRRESAIERDDADLADLRRQVRHLTRRVRAQELREDEHNQVLLEHAAWDWQTVQQCMERGVPIVTPPPPLRPHMKETGS